VPPKTFVDALSTICLGHRKDTSDPKSQLTRKALFLLTIETSLLPDDVVCPWGDVGVNL